MEAIQTKNKKPIKLVYLIGTYPELTNTFIDREIATLRQLGNFNIQIMSIRYPITIDSCSPEQKALCQETIYLVPKHWYEFNFVSFILANFYFIFSKPKVYFSTLFELLSQPMDGFKASMLTILHFLQGVYAAYLLRSNPFDHMHVHFMDRAVLVALVVVRFLGKTYSFTAHAADIYTKVIHVRKKIEDSAFMVTVSKYNKKHLLAEYSGIQADKIHILHPWVDISQFSSNATQSVHDSLHILSVGRLVEKKGHKDLIEAIHYLHEKNVNLECRIVGEGPLHAQLMKRIKEHSLQDRVQLLGGLPQENVLNLLKNWADVFVLPCVIAKNGDRDGIPVSIAEAMAMELPVISTDIVGINELIQPGSGLLVPPHAPAVLGEALYEIVTQNPSTTIKMGQRGREIIEKEFNLYKGTQELAELFTSTVHGEIKRYAKEV